MVYVPWGTLWLSSANALALANWVDVYDGHLGIALTDTYTTDNFFSSFDTQYAKLFDGLRWIAVILMYLPRKL